MKKLFTLALVLILVCMLPGCLSRNPRITTRTVTTEETTIEETTTEPEPEPIYLMSEDIGEYGKMVAVEDDFYIWYYIPEGTYEVDFLVALGTWQNVRVCKDKLTISEYGFEETVTVLQVNYDPDAEGQTITVGPGEHVALTLNTNVELTPVN